MWTQLTRLIPGINRVVAERDRLRNELGKLGHPPGHFYSPIADDHEVSQRYASLLDPEDTCIPGIDLNRAAQVEWLHKVAGFYSEQPFGDQKTDEHRYYFRNNMFLESDALFLYGLIRAIEPKQIVEVGSGFSSAVMLDTAERFLDTRPKFTFIEPHPDRLLSLLSKEDQTTTDVITKKVQDVESKPWESLTEGDILFIDSSHVCKCGSDVQFLFTEVLPRLASGVFIHIHDISFPFEYPQSWLTDRKWAWNEAYIVQSFLQFNQQFKIIAWAPYLNLVESQFIENEMPLCRNDFGGSIWIQRVPE